MFCLQHWIYAQIFYPSWMVMQVTRIAMASASDLQSLPVVPSSDDRSLLGWTPVDRSWMGSSVPRSSEVHSYSAHRFSHLSWPHLDGQISMPSATPQSFVSTILRLLTEPLSTLSTVYWLRIEFSFSPLSKETPNSVQLVIYFRTEFCQHLLLNLCMQAILAFQDMVCHLGPPLGVSDHPLRSRWTWRISVYHRLYGRFPYRRERSGSKHCTRVGDWHWWLSVSIWPNLVVDRQILIMTCFQPFYNDFFNL